MNIVLTGSSGFLGRIVHDKLKAKHKVLSLGRANGCSIKVKDIANITNLPAPLDEINSVIHIAGLAHVNPKDDDSKMAFDIVNFEGTKSLCSWIETWTQKPEALVFISSVSVYGLEIGSGISEKDELLGKTPYALSKIKAEQFLLKWGEKLGIRILILRLPLIVGSNPPGNLGKMILAIRRGTYFSIGGGKARKSMVLAEDVANLLATCPNVAGIYNLTDGVHPSFAELESLIAKQLGKSSSPNLPLKLARLLGKVGDVLPIFPITTNTIKKITQDLTFSDSKARQNLNWNPSSVIEKWKI
jgi:nucleoside-diphosphate-sugar epimerase